MERSGTAAAAFTEFCIYTYGFFAEYEKSLVALLSKAIIFCAFLKHSGSKFLEDLPVDFSRKLGSL